MNKRTIMLPALMLVFFGLIFTACSGTKKAETSAADKTEQKGNTKGGLMVLAIGSDPSIVNPLYANDRVSLTIAHVLYDPLYTVKSGEIIYNGLAAQLEHSPDFLKYTLTFRKDVTWHDGTPLTAADMMYTLSVIMDEKQNTKGRSTFVFGDKSVKYTQKDDYTVEFELPQINMSFTQDLADVKPIPKHIYEGQADIAKSPDNAKPVGNGSFKFKEQKSGELYQVERNDNYYGDVALLDGIVYRVIPDSNAVGIALENGEITASYVRAAQVERYKTNERLQLVTFSEGMVNNIFFRVSNPKVNDVKVRQALSYAIDKEKLLKGAYGGSEYATIAHSPFSQETQYYTNDVEKYPYNIEKAKELLKEAGVASLSLRLMYTAGNAAQEKEGLLIQEMLKQIGVTVELLPLERGAFIEKLLNVNNQDFEMALNGYVMGDNPDTYRALFTIGSPENFSGYINPEINTLFTAAAVETDNSKREKMYKDIQQMLVKDAVQISTAYVKSIVAVNKQFGNLEAAHPAPIHMFDYFNKISKNN